MRIARPRRAWPAPLVRPAGPRRRPPRSRRLPKVPEGFKVRLVAAVPAVDLSLPDRHRARRRRSSSPRTRWTRSARTRPTTAASSSSATARTPSSSPRASAPSSAWPGTTAPLYVMNMPRLTVLRDTDGDGKADQSKELFKDLGPSPNRRPERPHRLGPPVRHGRLALHLGRRQGRPQASTAPTAGRPSSSAAGRCAAGPTAPGIEVDLDRHPQPPRAQPRRLATTSSPTTTPTTATAGGPASRTTSTAAITAIPTTTTPARTACSTGWPSTAAAPPAAASSTRRTPGPRNTAAWPSGPSGARGTSPRSGSSPTGASFKVAEYIEFVEPGDGERLPPDRPGPLLRRQDPVRRRLGHGRLGEQDREGRPRLRGDLRRQGRDEAPRQGFRPDRRPDQGARRTPRSTSGCGRRRP